MSLNFTTSMTPGFPESTPSTSNVCISKSMFECYCQFRRELGNFQSRVIICSTIRWSSYDVSVSITSLCSFIHASHLISRSVIMIRVSVLTPLFIPWSV